MPTVLVTGAASGIGKATALFLLEKGWQVFGADQNAPGLEDLKAHGAFTSLLMDVTDEDSVRAARERVEAVTDGLDALVNVAGIFDHFPVSEGEYARFDRILKVNVGGAFLLVRTFLPRLHRKKGRVVNISSETALALMPLQVYGMSQRMLEVYTSVLRQELALLDMPVILIRPGAHKTPLLFRSAEMLGEIDANSLFVDVLEKGKRMGQDIIAKTKHEPISVAQKVYKALTVNRPRKVYEIHVSGNFRFLSFLPQSWQEKLLRMALK